MSLTNYEIQNIIGNGTTSVVYIAEHKIKKIMVALKFIRQQSRQITQMIKQEKQILRKIDSKHVIKLIESFQANDRLVLVLQYCNGGNLNQYIQSKVNKKLDESEAIQYIEQIISAFTALNKINCLHRDIKPQNILISNGIIKVADFGGSICLKNKDELRKTYFGSRDYMSPQRIKERSYGPKADIWSLGCIFFKMLTGISYKQQFGKEAFEQFTNQRIKEFFLKTLEPNPDNRIAWKQLFNFKFDNKNSIPSYIRIYEQNRREIESDVKSILSTEIEQVIIQENALDKFEQLRILNKISTLYEEELDSILYPLRYLYRSIQLLDNAQVNLRVYFIAIIKCIKIKVNILLNGLKIKKNQFNVQNFDLFLTSKLYHQTLTNIIAIKEQLQINFTVYFNSLNEIVNSGLHQLRKILLNQIIDKEFLMDFQNNIDIKIFKKYNDKIRMLLTKLIILRLANEVKMSKYAYEQEFDEYGCFKVQNLEKVVDKYRQEVLIQIFN